MLAGPKERSRPPPRNPETRRDEPYEFTRVHQQHVVRSFCQENDRDLGVRRSPVSDCADGVAIRRGGVPARLGGEEFLYMRSSSATCLSVISAPSVRNRAKRDDSVTLARTVGTSEPGPPPLVILTKY